ncbi:MAG: PspC domain-containing protein [bacterium]|nr:PspC domain-containing protein [bacterium]
MNKTVTINISGIIFHIEEDAYESLSKYLSTIKGYFSATDGGNEIMGDIEARIAELLQAKINVGKQVILMVDVDHVKTVMGKPEEFGAEPSAEEKKSDERREDVSGEPIKRRLFRNPDDKAIGGVCSGLAAYFDVDTVWIRLAMFLLIFFGGLSLWVYIILWIVMPEARSTADKFAMRGESANINTIYKSFKEEADDVKNRFTKYGKEFKDQNYSQAIRSNAVIVMSTIFNIFGRLFGFLLVMLGGVFLFGYITSLLGISIADGNADLSHWRSVIFTSPGDYAWGVIAFIIVAGIPILMLIYAGVKLLFKIRYSNRWLNRSLGIIWLLGFLLGCYVTVITVKQFSENSRVKETIVLRGIGDTLVIKLSPEYTALKKLEFANHEEVENYLGHHHSGYYFGENNRQLSVLGFADLNVVESASDSVEMIISRNARGYDKQDANENAKAINYSYSQNKNELVFDEIFSVAEGTKFRAQELDIKIKLPKGKVVYFDKSVKYLLDDIDNTTNTWDGNMVGRRWIMTDRGLKCIDCENLESADNTDSEDVRIHHRHGDNITIDGDGINVKDNQTEIKIDGDGIKIKTPEKDIEVNSSGVKKKEK